MSLAQSINHRVKSLPAGAIYIVCAAHIFWLFYKGLTGGLGVEPIKALEHAYGLAGLQLMVLTLSVTPLRKVLGLNFLKFRRALGLSAFLYICAHLMVWIVLDVQWLSQIWADIVKRPYITVGMGAFAILIPLAATSNNRAIRKLGTLKWRRLHKFTYAAAILGAIHFVMLSKGLQLEPIAYFTAILVLIAMRFNSFSVKRA